MLLSSRGGAERTAATVGIKFFFKSSEKLDDRDARKCVCEYYVCKHVWQRDCVCVPVCVLARRAASSSGRGLWFVIDDLYAPPT